MSQHLQEIAYLNELQREEKQRAEHYLQAIAPEMSEQSRAAVTDLFSDISSRIRVVEEYLAKDLGPVDDSFNPEGSSIDASTIPPNDEYKIAISDIEDFTVLSSLNYNAQGIPFRYAMSEKKLEISFPINRKKKMTLALDIEFCSSHSLLSQFSIQIDGVTLKHKIINNGKRLLVHIPTSQTGGFTHLRVKFPKLNSDERVAISDIHCVPKLSLLSFIKQKL